MKFTSLILCFILILLSGIPCADGEAQANERVTGNVASHHDKHGDESHPDQCSPFCVCSCCGLQMLNLSADAVFALIEIPEMSTRQQLHYKAPLASPFSGSIWQPPQLV